MKNNLKKNTKIKLISFLSAVVLWMYVMAIVDPEDTKLFENIPVTVTNTEELEEDDLVVYPKSDLVTDIYITGKLSDLQKINEDDIHINGSINNPIEGKNYLYLKVNPTKQVSYEFKSDFIVVKLEKLIHREKDINTEIIGEYKDDVDTITLQQSTVSVSAPRVLIEQVDHIKATVQVDSKENDNLNQRVKLTAVDVDGKEVTGVNLATKSINAEIKFLEEKNVPINIQQQGDSEDIKSYEVNPKEVILKGKKEILDKLTIATLKFTDLLPYRKTDYIFDPVKFSSLEGKTGPYVLYTVVRIKSLLNKVDTVEVKINSIPNDTIKDIILKVIDLPNILTSSYNEATLSYIVDYLYELCNLFNKFYNSYNVINEEDKKLKDTYIATCSLVYNIIHNLLNILAIDEVDKM